MLPNLREKTSKDARVVPEQLMMLPAKYFVCAGDPADWPSRNFAVFNCILYIILRDTLKQVVLMLIGFIGITPIVCIR